MIVMFGFVSLQGMQMLARVDFVNNEHNFLIAAVSVAVGVGFNIAISSIASDRISNVLLERNRDG